MLSLRTSCSFILVIVLSAQSSNYYSLLGVNKDASESDIKKAYRSLALEYHPDKIAKNATEEEKTLSKEKFLLIQEAYEILSDSEKRSQYNDAQNGIKYDVSNEPEVDRYLKNPFAMFLRTSRISMAFFLDIDKPEPPSLHLPIYIDGTAIFNGYKGNYTYYRRSICPVCLGKKGFEGKHRICTLCDGTGVANHLYEMNKQNIIQLTRTTCGACNGYGFIPDGQCTHCHGKGTSMIEHSVSFELPRGFPNGKKLIFHHLGHQISDGRTGHLYLEIQYLFNAPWKVDADNPDSLDMFYSLDVSIIEIVKGFKRHILGPDGSPMEVAYKGDKSIIGAMSGFDIIIPDRGLVDMQETKGLAAVCITPQWVGVTLSLWKQFLKDEGIAESDSLFNSLIKLYLLYGNAEESDMESEGYRYEVDSSDISVIRRAS